MRIVVCKPVSFWRAAFARIMIRSITRIAARTSFVFGNAEPPKAAQLRCHSFLLELKRMYPATTTRMASTLRRFLSLTDVTRPHARGRRLPSRVEPAGQSQGGGLIRMPQLVRALRIDDHAS